MRWTSIRKFKNEKQFQAGIQLIRRQIKASDAGHFLSDIADVCMEALLHRVEVNYSARQELPDCLGIIALGRLGARELTFGSDVDLVFVYDAVEHETYNKLSRRFIGSVTALTREGRLYEVDTRLRPSGRDGLLAVSLETFDKYLDESAWTFELMAFTRARVIAGNPMLRQKLQDVIHKHLGVRRDRMKLACDIHDLRKKITQEFGSDNIWNLKYVHGGLMDLDFLAQYLVLVHCPDHKELAGISTFAVFQILLKHKLIEETIASQLLEAHRFLTEMFVLMRLCAVGILDEAKAPQGLTSLIAMGLEKPDFASVKATLIKTLETVRKNFTFFVSTSQED